MPGIYELRPQLSDRLTRLKDLIEYIRRNGLLVKVSHFLALQPEDKLTNFSCPSLQEGFCLGTARRQKQLSIYGIIRIGSWSKLSTLPTLVRADVFSAISNLTRHSLCCLTLLWRLWISTAHKRMMIVYGNSSEVRYVLLSYTKARLASSCNS